MIQRINLLPEELRTVSKKPFYLISFISVIIYLSILYVTNNTQRGNIEALETKKTSLQQSKELLASQNLKYREVFDKINQTEAKNREIEATAGLAKKISDENMRWSVPLHHLSNIVPAGLWFSSLSSSNIVSGENKIKIISIDGMALSNSRITDFMAALESSPYFDGVSLGYVQSAEYDGRKAFSFEITFKIRGKG